MNPQCQRAQEELVRCGGRIEALPEELERHVAACSACREAARLERGLSRAFADADAQLGEVSVPLPLQALPARRWRFAPWAPVVPAVGIIAGSMLVLGRLPGATAGAAFPGAAGQVAIDVLRGIGAGFAAAPHIIAVVSRILPLGLGIGSAIAAVAGGVVLVRTLGRARGELM